MIDKEYMQKEGESFLDWKFRLVIGKNEKTVNLEWDEIIDLLGLDCSEDHERKKSYGAYEYHKYIMGKTLGAVEDEVLKHEFDKQLFNLHKEKVKVQDQKREERKILREVARAEHIFDEIKQSAEYVAKIKPLVWEKPTGITLGDKQAVLMISDWHSELKVDNYFNKFDGNELINRINKLTTKTIEYCKFHNVNTLHVVNLGDMISGLIHVSTRVQNTEDTVTQTMYISEVIGQVLVHFANYIPHIKYYNVIDNHSRVTPDKDASLGKENFARFISWYLKPRLIGYTNIEIVENTIDDEIVVFDVCGYKIFGVHGHLDKVSNVVENLSLMLKQFPDYVLLSHYHHNIEEETHGIEIIVNASLIGTDEYAKSIRKTAKPSQKLLIFNKEDGRECSYNIIVNKK